MEAPESLLVVDSAGWHNEGWAIMTRADFYCVQWERKPAFIVEGPVTFTPHED